MHQAGRSVPLLAAGIFCAALLTACQAGATTTPGAASGAKAQAASSASPTVAPVILAVVPAGGAADVALNAPVRVSVSAGTLTAVTVTGLTAKGKAAAAVTGAMSDPTTWDSDDELDPSTSYTVAVTAKDANGAEQRLSSTFSTVAPTTSLTTSISPLGGAVVGVGMPVIVRFNADIDDAHRSDVQKRLVVTATPEVEGAWSWIGPREVHFRPRVYWPAHTEVAVDVALRGLDLGNGAWGTHDRKVSFTIGDSMVSKVDVVHHTMTVLRNEKPFMTVPVTTGKADFLTRNGTKVVLEKFPMKTMDAATTGIAKGSKDYYRLDVPFAMRVTWTGEFVHAAPWSTGSQGRTNVSHGCVGMSMANAKRLFGLTRVGDVVTVVGSPRKLEPNNGWTDWNVPWSTWLAGSAA